MVKIFPSGRVTWLKRGNGTENISSNILPFLNKEVEIAPKTTVKALYLIIKNNPDFLSTLSRIYGSELVEEGLKRKKKHKFNKKAKIEFYWYLDQFETDVVKINPVPAVHGIENKKNEVFGLDFLPASEIRDLEVVIKDEIETSSVKVSLKPTLGQILYGLIWELSFYGPPAKRDANLPGM